MNNNRQHADAEVIYRFQANTADHTPEPGKKHVKELVPMSDRPLKTLRHMKLKVLDNRSLYPGYYVISLEYPEDPAIEPQPGQFFHIVCDAGDQMSGDDGEVRNYALTLRRPFSVHRIHYKGFEIKSLELPGIIPYEQQEVIVRPVFKIDILYEIIGKGTRSLSRVLPGTYLDVIGPSGKGFNIDKTRMAVIVGGGIGTAPLAALAETLRFLGIKTCLYLGALGKELFLPVLSRPEVSFKHNLINDTQKFLGAIENEFMEIGAERVRVCTDDGSLGEKGLVTELLESDLESGFLSAADTTIYACGPAGMIKAVSKTARRYKIPCQFLLEERMACGIGACYSCTCNVKDENGKPTKKRVCVDGPVFNSEEIIWQD